jgi:sec-independent protein translocase protein TatB
MFGLSLGHLILFGVIALIFVGPEQLPEVARTIARLLNELRRATADFQSQFTAGIDQVKNQVWNEPPSAPQPLPAPASEATPAPSAPGDEEPKS